MRWPWSERSPQCAECGGPLRELGEAIVRAVPPVFEVSLRCEACGEITGQVRVAPHAWP